MIKNCKHLIENPFQVYNILEKFVKEFNKKIFWSESQEDFYQIKNF